MNKEELDKILDTIRCEVIETRDDIKEIRPLVIHCFEKVKTALVIQYFQYFNELNKKILVGFTVVGAGIFLLGVLITVFMI